jgi:hypothetical protein
MICSSVNRFLFIVRLLERTQHYNEGISGEQVTVGADRAGAVQRQRPRLPPLAKSIPGSVPIRSVRKTGGSSEPGLLTIARNNPGSVPDSSLATGMAHSGQARGLRTTSLSRWHMRRS